MSKTLLAVDDSATMRKVLDITFSGEDFQVVGAENREGALAQLTEQTNVIVLDTSLGGEDAYALAKEMRQRAPSATLVLMASRYNPYDAGKGRDAGVDEFVDKPFDTQQMIDKVKKAMLAREAGGAAAAPPAARSAAPIMGPSGTVPSIQSPFMQSGGTRPTGTSPQAPAPPPPPPAAAAAPPPRPPPPAPPATASRTHTLSFENSPFAAPPAPPPAQIAMPPKAPPPAAAPPPAPPPRTAPVAAAAPAGAVAAGVNGHLAGKLGELGLTQAQVDAVLALSRDVVERVVWEVVPQLAETMIKEEIARLTKEG